MDNRRKVQESDGPTERGVLRIYQKNIRRDHFG